MYIRILFRIYRLCAWLDCGIVCDLTFCLTGDTVIWACSSHCWRRKGWAARWAVLNILQNVSLMFLLWQPNIHMLHTDACTVHWDVPYKLCTWLLCSSSVTEEKRRVESRLGTIEEELEEEQSNAEAAAEKAKKAQLQADSLSSELASAQSSLHQAESTKSSLEKQVCTCTSTFCRLNMVVFLRWENCESDSRKLKALGLEGWRLNCRQWITRLPGWNKNWIHLKSNTTVCLPLDSFRLSPNSFRENNQSRRTLRRQDKKMKDMLTSIDEERKSAEQYKQQVCLFCTSM